MVGRFQAGAEGSLQQVKTDSDRLEPETGGLRTPRCKQRWWNERDQDAGQKGWLRKTPSYCGSPTRRWETTYTQTRGVRPLRADLVTVCMLQLEVPDETGRASRW